jgi:hypothetical protein
MWILNFLPDWIFYAILGIGVVGLLVTYLLRFIPIPALYVYRTPIQLVSIVLIAYGVYMAGAISNENEWKAKVAELEKQFSESQVQTEKVNTEVITKYVTKREVVYQKAEEQIRYIDREIVKYNDICKLPSEVIKIHNEAAKAPK